MSNVVADFSHIGGTSRQTVVIPATNWLGLSMVAEVKLINIRIGQFISVFLVTL